MTFQHCVFENFEVDRENKTLFHFTCLERVEFIHCTVRNFSSVSSGFKFIDNPLFFTSDGVLQLSIQDSTFSNIVASPSYGCDAIIGVSQGDTTHFLIGNTIFNKCGRGYLFSCNTFIKNQNCKRIDSSPIFKK